MNTNKRIYIILFNSAHLHLSWNEMSHQQKLTTSCRQKLELLNSDQLSPQHSGEHDLQLSLSKTMCMCV